MADGFVGFFLGGGRSLTCPLVTLSTVDVESSNGLVSRIKIAIFVHLVAFTKNILVI